MSRIPSDQKTHKLARRALIRAKESARLSHMMPEESALRTPKRDAKAWRRLGLRMVALLLSVALATPGNARGASHGSHGNHGHHAGGGASQGAYVSRMSGK